jgi:hypothetical protein
VRADAAIRSRIADRPGPLWPDETCAVGLRDDDGQRMRHDAVHVLRDTVALARDDQVDLGRVELVDDCPELRVGGSLQLRCTKPETDEPGACREDETDDENGRKASDHVVN